jgi:hypothetical protein
MVSGKLGKIAVDSTDDDVSLSFGRSQSGIRDVSDLFNQDLEKIENRRLVCSVLRMGSNCLEVRNLNPTFARRQEPT